MAQRGRLTDEIKSRAIELLMRPIDQDELDLMRHAMQCALSGRSLNDGIASTSQGEALARWVAAGWVWGEEGNLRLVRDFWEICAQLVWHAYCAADVGLPD